MSYLSGQTEQHASSSPIMYSHDMLEDLGEFFKEHLVGMSLFAICTGLVTTYIYERLTAPSPREQAATDPVIARAVSDAHDTVSVMGVVGLSIAVDECYGELQDTSSTNVVKYCFAMHLAGAYLDDGMTKYQNWPRKEELEFENVEKRLQEALKLTNAPSWFLETVHKDWVPGVEAALYGSSR